MKKTILALLLILFSASSCLAASVQESLKAVVKSRGGAALTCTTANDVEIYSNITAASNGNFGYTSWIAQRFVLSATTRITAFTFYLEDAVTYDSCNVLISIYSDSSGLPGTEISGSGGVSLAETSMADGVLGTYEIALTAPKELAPGTYWLVMHSDHASETASTVWRYGNGTIAGALRALSTNGGSTWSAAVGADDEGRYSIRGCQ